MDKHVIANKISENRNPWFSFFLLILVSFGCLVIFQSIAFVLAPLIFGVPMDEMIGMMQGASSGEKMLEVMYLLQAISAIGGFIVGPLIYLWVLDKAKVKELLPFKVTSTKQLVMTIPIMFVFIIGISSIIEFNMNLTFPEPFESWARAQEDQLAELTKMLTTFDGFGMFLVGIFVVAVIPGIGEELLFRGVMQPLLIKATKSHHVGIWLAAIIFGLIHMQFYGVIPRILLGAAFGYLYHYSGSLVIPMLAHFFNNAFSLSMAYLAQLEIIDPELAEGTDVVNVYFSLFALGLSIYFIYLFKKTHPSNQAVS
ncbi:CPBP family intramembrane glutamic endopeptidase [Penaeicola halotolerans]|uniref:CPBP family intramembrane glutamic endopeptidase n=1 Tax=Penaeicola halotolerans TaxID=2793196 RepID=UPI001CF87755|nr:CPBP family intramembrane glutamic endopeptidase [Penaeicola halotolerans]